MFNIECEVYAEKDAFKTGGKEWDDAVDRDIEWQKEYGFTSGCRDLFFSLLQTGKACTVDQSRAHAVLAVLSAKGYPVTYYYSLKRVI